MFTEIVPVGAMVSVLVCCAQIVGSNSVKAYELFG